MIDKDFIEKVKQINIPKEIIIKQTEEFLAVILAIKEKNFLVRCNLMFDMCFRPKAVERKAIEILLKLKEELPESTEEKADYVG